MDLEKGVTEFEMGEVEPHSSNPNDPSNPNGEPFEGMEFDSEPSARIFYNSYARRAGFSIRAHKCQRARRDGSLICRQIVCSREGFRRQIKHGRWPTRQHTVTRVGCKARMTVKKKNPSGKWYITKFVKEHNHELVPPDKVHRLRSHRRITGPARSLIDTLQAAGMGAAEIMAVLIKESGGADNVGFTKVDCQNYMSNSKQKSLGSGGQCVFDYLRQMKDEDPGFFCAVQDGNFVSSTTGNVFWADANARKNYSCFGDAVVFDLAYRWNDYRVPFAPFTGLNHHGKPVLFGCALVLNESETSFLWLFQTFLEAMSGKHPFSITTDHDRIIHSAVLEVLPRTRHRFCKWNVIREVEERLSDVYHVNCNFEAEFLRCINATETTDEFESSWKSLVQRYELVDNEWLHSMYKARHQWVPVYLRDTFFGEISVAQGSDTVDSYFDGYINASTNVQELIKQYEKAIASRHENEMKTDYVTLNMTPVLNTPSPMEKQAASLYTRKIFTKFQEELVETLAYAATAIDDSRSEITYRVAKYGEAHKAHLVRFNVFDKKASCSCQLFEYAGIICRHILAVFRVTNILTLPSHYILKRWTRNAKSGLLLDEHTHGLQSNPLESFTARYDSLRQKVMRYVEKGSESKHTYSVAMDALHEASKRVAAVKNLGAGPEQNISENDINEIQPCTTDEDKKIQELTTELEGATQRCEAYRQNLVGLLKIMEEQKLKVSVEVHNFRLNLQAESVNLNDSR